jgi:hypothetical protein
MSNKTATLTIDFDGDGVSSIRVTAEDAATRELAMEKVKRILPALELCESLLSDEPFFALAGSENSK